MERVTPSGEEQSCREGGDGNERDAKSIPLEDLQNLPSVDLAVSALSVTANSKRDEPREASVKVSNQKDKAAAGAAKRESKGNVGKGKKGGGSKAAQRPRLVTDMGKVHDLVANARPPARMEGREKGKLQQRRKGDSQPSNGNGVLPPLSPVPDGRREEEERARQNSEPRSDENGRADTRGQGEGEAAGPLTESGPCAMPEGGDSSLGEQREGEGLWEELDNESAGSPPQVPAFGAAAAAAALAVSPDVPEEPDDWESDWQDPSRPPLLPAKCKAAEGEGNPRVSEGPAGQPQPGVRLRGRGAFRFADKDAAAMYSDAAEEASGQEDERRRGEREGEGLSWDNHSQMMADDRRVNGGSEGDDCLPLPPRPATSASTARRLLARALSDQKAVAHSLLHDVSFSQAGGGRAEQLRIEAERKMRLATREPLKAAAWGGEGEDEARQGTSAFSVSEGP
eukprot:TRINITY_DN15089_c0_g2_i1.p1 TRINITY_DN15089_c0_g2~~TRINITY_DN15089_c0_g2_i1.p1  ORF type:complete len:454 (+),score=127.26 TRINITY_DN15089_c0_g2_i1:542-1903(+)